MPKRPAAPRNLRICLAWRNGRPRWEPSPASRRAGLKGVDLRRADGTWMDRGEAIDAADARTLWADTIRRAVTDKAGDGSAAHDLQRALDALEPPADVAAVHRRELLSDLFAAARQVLGASGDAAPRVGRAGRTVARLIDAYFAPDAHLEISEGTREAYTTQAKRLRAKFGDKLAAEVNRGQVANWYQELLRPEGGALSLSNANQCMGAAASIFAWGARQDPPWLPDSPVVKLRIKAARGRLVMWSVDAEQGFVAWADASGYADLADAVSGLLWTGASPVDLCAANLSDFKGQVWRFTRHKTRRHHQEAMPAIMPPLRRRLDRRAAQLVTAIDGAFLFDPRSGRRHDTASLGRRFAEARALFAATNHADQDFIHLHLQDCRDTCITRLWEAGVSPHKMYAWTGHSLKSINEILREHYVVLREKGSMDMADKLRDWAEREGMAI